MSRTGDLLMPMYKAMYAKFGHQHWWPGDTPLEICLGAILTQNTNWRNVEKALAQLKAANLLNLAALDALSLGELAEKIRPTGYFNVKAKRLKNFIAEVRKNFGDDLSAFLDRPACTLRKDLLTINGIGRETADSIVLYAAEKLSFVIDAYTARILLRHGLIDETADYESIKELFETSLPGDLDLWNDYHAQLVAVGKEYCRPRNPRCEDCPLAEFPHEVPEIKTEY